MRAYMHVHTYINCPASRMTMDDPFKSPAYSMYLFLPLVYTVQCVALSPTGIYSTVCISFSHWYVQYSVYLFLPLVCTVQCVSLSPTGIYGTVCISFSHCPFTGHGDHKGGSSHILEEARSIIP